MIPEREIYSSLRAERRSLGNGIYIGMGRATRRALGSDVHFM